MSVAGSVTSGLHAALLFARGRGDGVRYLDADMAGAARSFWAMPVCLPAVVCVLLMGWLQFGVPRHAAHAFGLEVAGFAVGWIGFAVLSFHIVPLLNAGSRWPRFIVAWNWCNVVENMLLVVGSIPAVLGAPTIISEASQLVAIGWAVWMEWFAIRQSLAVGPFAAAALMILDQTIGLMLATLNVSIMHG